MKKRTVINEIEGINTKYLKTIKNVTVDLKQAFKAEITNYVENNLLQKTLKIRLQFLLALVYNIRYIKKGKKVDRYFHSISNLSKISRKFLTINNMKFHELDVSNCQPLLLVYYLKVNCHSFDEAYIQDCENATFYSKFFTKKPTAKDLKQLKKGILSCVYFGFEENNKINKKFKVLYPLTHLALKYIHENKIELAVELQNLEAEVFNNLIPKESNHFFTIFDSINFDNIADKEDLTSQIEQKFKSLGLSVKVK
ncbi:MAG: hypothetical protein ACEQSR_04290 [Candidatus Methylacidiphilales bacterium]